MKTNMKHALSIECKLIFNHFWFLWNSEKEFDPICVEQEEKPKKNEGFFKSISNFFKWKQVAKEKTGWKLANLNPDYWNMVNKAVFENRESTKQDFAYYESLEKIWNYIDQESDQLFELQKKLGLDGQTVKSINWDLLSSENQLKTSFDNLKTTFFEQCKTWEINPNHESNTKNFHTLIFESFEKLNIARKKTLEAWIDKIWNFGSQDKEKFLKLNELLTEEIKIYFNEVTWVFFDSLRLISWLWLKIDKWNIAFKSLPTFPNKEIMERQEELINNVVKLWNWLDSFLKNTQWAFDPNTFSKQNFFILFEEASNKFNKNLIDDFTKWLNPFVASMLEMIIWSPPEVIENTRAMLEQFALKHKSTYEIFSKYVTVIKNPNSEIMQILSNPNFDQDPRKKEKVIQFFKWFKEANSALMESFWNLTTKLLWTWLNQKKIFDYYSKLQSTYIESIQLAEAATLIWSLLLNQTTRQFLLQFLKFPIFILPWQEHYLKGQPS